MGETTMNDDCRKKPEKEWRDFMVTIENCPEHLNSETIKDAIYNDLALTCRVVELDQNQRQHFLKVKP